MKVVLLSEGIKVRQGEPINQLTQLHLTCGKNDSCAFQIMLFPEHDAVLTLDHNPCFHPAGNTTNYRLHLFIENSSVEITLYSEQFFKDDQNIQTADLLMPFLPVHLKKDVPEVLWAELQVPAHTPPGTYRGELVLTSHTMFSAEKKEQILPFTLCVKNVTLPAPADHTFYLNLWQHNSNIARKHEVPLWSDAHFEIIARYLQTLADLGQKAITIIASEIPWSGQYGFLDFYENQDFYEYNMISVTKNKDGSFSYDYSIMQRYIDLCFQYGIQEKIEIIGLCSIWSKEEYGFGAVAPDYPDAIRIRYFDQADQCYHYMSRGSEIKAYIRSLQDYLIRRNLIDRVIVSADEPADSQQFHKSIQALKDCAPAFSIKAALNHVEFVEEHEKELSAIAPCLHYAVEKLDFLKNAAAQHRTFVTWYVCCIPDYPNTFLRSPLCEARLIPILNYFLGLDGFMRWNYTVWPNHPRSDIRAKYPEWSAGETNFVYPSRGGYPLLSLRYMALKRGISDYELLKMAEAKCPQILQEVYHRLFSMESLSDFYKNPDTRPYSLNYDDYQAAKLLLLQALEASD